RLSKHRTVPIKCVGVFDTVGRWTSHQAKFFLGLLTDPGALGIPSLGLFPGHPALEYTFVDTMVAPNVQHAFQALALDEHRLPFTPTIWETPSGRTDLDLKQCWFPGSHGNIGGGYPDTMSTNITLVWMVAQMIK